MFSFSHGPLRLFDSFSTQGCQAERTMLSLREVSAAGLSNVLCTAVVMRFAWLRHRSNALHLTERFACLPTVSCNKWDMPKQALYQPEAKLCCNLASLFRSRGLCGFGEVTSKGCCAQSIVKSKQAFQMLSLREYYRRFALKKIKIKFKYPEVSFFKRRIFLRMLIE